MNCTNRFSQLIFGVFFSLDGEPSDGDYYPYNVAYLQEKLTGDVLVLHDEWDTLVPVGPSQALAENESVSEFWFPHTTATDYNEFIIEHQQPSEGLDANILFTFSYSFILTRLLEPEAQSTVIYSYASFVGFFEYIKNQQDSGANISWLVPRLEELAASGVILLEIDSENFPHTQLGYQIVGEFLNNVWGAVLDESGFSTNVAAYLANADW
ncbi:MAG: hypothetical protein KUG82_12765 [Pseudomonadales bacterium]|nr:hypothetical protein [Pseudomonadales bacterium]